MVRFSFTFAFLILATMLLCRVTWGANDKDRQECTEQLVGLATCLTYVGGNAKSPTPDCCSGLKQVLNTDKKCLCVVIKDRNDPDLGLTINVTLALGLPTVCHATANVTKCPELLHLAPNSTDAQVFYQYGHSSGANASSPIPSASANAPTSTKGSRANATSQNSHGSGAKRTLFKWEFVLTVIISSFFSLISVM